MADDKNQNQPQADNESEPKTASIRDLADLGDIAGDAQLIRRDGADADMADQPFIL